MKYIIKESNIIIKEIKKYIDTTKIVDIVNNFSSYSESELNNIIKDYDYKWGSSDRSWVIRCNLAMRGEIKWKDVYAPYAWGYWEYTTSYNHAYKACLYIIKALKDHKNKKQKPSTYNIDEAKQYAQFAKKIEEGTFL